MGSGRIASLRGTPDIRFGTRGHESDTVTIRIFGMMCPRLNSHQYVQRIKGPHTASLQCSKAGGEVKALFSLDPTALDCKGSGPVCRSTAGTCLERLFYWFRFATS